LSATTEVGVEASGKQFGEHADGGAGTLDPAEKGGMRVRGGVGEDVVEKFLVNFCEWRGGGGERNIEATTSFGRGGLPDRALANVLSVVEDVVEHVVGLGAEGLPVGRIEGGVLRKG